MNVISQIIAWDERRTKAGKFPVISAFVTFGIVAGLILCFCRK